MRLSVLPLLLTGCVIPTSPSGEPELVFHDATVEQEASGQELWTEIKECVGYNGLRSHQFPVYIVPEFFTCDEKLARGCYYRGDKIHVVGTEAHYLPALGNEFVHYALDMTDREWYSHEGPVWEQCDWRSN